MCQISSRKCAMTSLWKSKHNFMFLYLNHYHKYLSPERVHATMGASSNSVASTNLYIDEPTLWRLSETWWYWVMSQILLSVHGSPWSGLKPRGGNLGMQNLNNPWHTTNMKITGIISSWRHWRLHFQTRNSGQCLEIQKWKQKVHTCFWFEPASHYCNDLS